MSETKFPDRVSGHWETPEGAYKAHEYSTWTREMISMGHLSDFALANAQYLVMRDSLELGQYQTAAKERIRWLSVQVAMRDQTIATQAAQIEALESEAAKYEIGLHAVIQERAIKDAQIEALTKALKGLLAYVEKRGVADLPHEYNEPRTKAPAVVRAHGALSALFNTGKK